jgi:hypothetical protein
MMWYRSKTIRGNYDYDRELSSIDTVPAYIISKFYVFGQGKCQLSVFFYATNIPRFTEDNMYYKWELTHTMVLERSCIRRPS